MADALLGQLRDGAQGLPLLLMRPIIATAADAKTITADLEERAAKGDQWAKDYLAAKTAAAT